MDYKNWSTAIGKALVVLGVVFGLAFITYGGLILIFWGPKTFGAIFLLSLVISSVVNYWYEFERQRYEARYECSEALPLPINEDDID